MNFDFNAFMHEWIGKRIADPTLVTNGEETASTMYQCVSFVKQYIRERFHIEPGNWGNAINFWDATNPNLYAFIDRVPTQEVEQGDIVILNGLAGNVYGHIGEATGNKNSSQFELLEQNGATGNGSGLNGDAIRTRWISKSRIAGVLRPKVALPLPFTLSEFTPTKWVTVPAGTNRWHMDYRTIEEMAAHPVYKVAEITNIQVRALASHIDGHQYYLENPAIHEGYNVKDCPDYTPPVYNPPAAPLTIPAVTYYELVTTVMTYASPADAKARNKPVTTTAQGTYIQLKSDEQARQLVKKNMDQDSFWINDYDNRVVEVVEAPIPAPSTVPVKITEAIEAAAENIPEPAPTPAQEWQAIATELGKHLNLFRIETDEDGVPLPVYYNSVNSRPLVIEDMTGCIDSRTGKVASATVQPFTKHIAMIGTIDIVEPDGRAIRYVLPAKCYGTSKFYLAPLSYFKLDKKTVLEKMVDVLEGISNDIKASDHLTAAQERIKLSIQGFVNKMKKD